VKKCAHLISSSLAFTAGLAGGASQADLRPNILWIMVDQQPATAMSCAGNPDLKTPAMDSLSAAGIRFERAYSVNPICVPARTAMMTGRMSHQTGVMTNIERYDVAAPSIGKLMTAAGYDTGYIGKWHIPMPTETRSNSWHGFNLMMAGSKAFNDQHFAQPAIDFIKKKRDQPFFLVTSFVNPHDICEWARRATGGFPASRTELWNGEIAATPRPELCPALPANFGIPANEPDIIREYQATQKSAYPVIGWPDERWRQYRWALNRLTERVDSEIGKILQALRAEGLDKNTLILLTSDHGDGNGAHQWNQKSLFYEETARVPLILSGPGVKKPGTVDTEHLISTGLDLFPTFCDYAGANRPGDLNGLSLRPLAEGRAAPWRTRLVSETVLSPRDNLPGPEGRMLRTKDYKYCVFSAGRIREQLIDMNKDPGEMHNLALDPDYASVLQQHRQQLADEMKQTGDLFVVPGISYAGWILKAE